MGAVVLLPRFTSRTEFDSFMWAYMVELLLTSLLNLGFERFAASDMAGGDSSKLSALFFARLATLPLTVVGVWALLSFVHERLPLPAIGALIVWVAAVQIQGLLFAILRGAGKLGVEPVLVAVARLVQAAALIIVASRGSALLILLLAVALPDLAMAVWLVLAFGSGITATWRPVGLPWRLLGTYTAIEVLGFAYLRADVVVVGHLLGPSPGATYSLAYRVLDGLTAMLTPFILYLFPTVARIGDDVTARSRLRRFVLGWAPIGAMPVALAVMFGAIAAPHLVHRLADARAALQVLMVTLPMFCFSAFELHLQSAEGRNRSPLVLGAALLAGNVVLNLLVVPSHGIVAAAWVLVGCEGAQAVWLGVRLWRAALVDRITLLLGATAVTLLLIAASFLASGRAALALAPSGGCLAATALSAVAQVRRQQADARR